MLDEIRARADAATEGPWKARGLECNTVVIDGSNKVLASLGDPLSGYCWKAAEFIAAARSDVPRLLAAVDAALALAEEWRYKGEFDWGTWQAGEGPDFEGHVLNRAAAELRAAVTEALEGK
jgi:hypothetical protein